MQNGSAKKILFLLLFALVSFLALRVNFSPLIGAPNQFFTFFQFFAPIAGAFLGPFLGVAAVLGAQVLDFFLQAKEASLLNILRLTPMLFAAFYFATHRKQVENASGILGIAIPLLAMAAFVLNPVGGQVWYFALFWTIPIIAKFLPENLFLRSLGATFTAHAVGGAIWAWTVPMTPEAWIALIPVVIFERTLFAAGISVSFVAFNTLLSRLEHLAPDWLKAVQVDKRYAL